MSLFFLVGMPASGKTYWGRKVAEHYHLPFTDLDTYIEAEQGTSITEIFKTQGEKYFREIERAALVHIIKANKEGIVACGGGTPVFYDNLQLMKDAGKVVYLNVPIDTLVKRINQEEQTRPLLQNTNPIKTLLEDMLEKRRAVYEQADYALNEDEISITDFKNIIDNV